MNYMVKSILILFSTRTPSICHWAMNCSYLNLLLLGAIFSFVGNVFLRSKIFYTLFYATFVIIPSAKGHTSGCIRLRLGKLK